VTETKTLTAFVMQLTSINVPKGGPPAVKELTVPFEEEHGSICIDMMYCQSCQISSECVSFDYEKMSSEVD